MRDHTGREITGTEDADTMITVWEIEPTTSADASHAVIRCYQDAVEHAKLVVETIMDDPQREWPVTITIRQAQMTLGDYEECCAANPY